MLVIGLRSFCRVNAPVPDEAELLFHADEFGNDEPEYDSGTESERDGDE